MEIAVVGDRKCGLLELECSPDEMIYSIGAIEQGILGMAVQMNEGHTVRIGGCGFRG